MSPSKEWSVVIQTYPYPIGGKKSKQYSITIPTKTNFARRFHILDPFQQYHGQRLADSAWHLGMTLDSRPC